MSRLIPAAGRLFTGWGHVDISPQGPVYLAGQFHERLSTHIQSPLTATALAIVTMNDGDEILDQTVMVSCDTLAIVEGLQDEVCAALGNNLQDFDPAKLILNATHSHTAPMLSKEPSNVVTERLLPYLDEDIRRQAAFPTSDDKSIVSSGEYRRYFIKQVCSAIQEAWQNLAPCKISEALGRAVIGHNRRVRYSDGNSMLYGDTNSVNFERTEGPCDSGVELLYLWDMDDTLTGIVAGVPCPAQVVEGESFVSADYWGELRLELAKNHPQPLQLLPLYGIGGDIAPRDLVRRGRGEPNMRSVEGAQEIARRLCREILYQKDHSSEKSHCVPLKHVALFLPLPLRRVSKAQYEAAQKEFDHTLCRIRAKEVTLEQVIFGLYPHGGVIDRYHHQQRENYYYTPVHVIRLGDVAIATNPFEVFTTFGMQMRARSCAQQLFTVSLACDRGKYLPTKEAQDGGHYSAIVASGLVGHEAGRELVETTVAAINAMWGE